MRPAPSRRQRHSGLGAAFAFATLLAIADASGASMAEAEDPERLLLAQVEDEPQPPQAEDEAAAPSEPAETEPPAGEPEAPPPGVEVMTIRGRGAGAIETEVTSSITQFDASTIEALGAQDISDLSRVTPNVNIVQPGATQATFFVRGVGLSDFSSNAAGAVTVFQDDVALNAPAIQTGQLYDVEGVDVMRGPQGSGPYRNASAGAIRVRSRRPTGNYTAQLRASLGRYDTKGDKGARNALIQDYEGGLETPIVANWLSSRFAFRLREADPYKTNGCGDALPLDQRRPRFNAQGTFGFPVTAPGVSQCGERNTDTLPLGGISRVPFGLPKSVNDEHNWAARGTLRFQPPDTELEFFLNAHGSRLDQDSTLGPAIGTVPLQGATDTTIRFAGQTPTGYVDRDVQEEFDKLCQRDPRFVGVRCTNRLATQTLSKRLAEDRPLDKRPYRGDYDRVGQTTRDAWGGFVSGEGEVFADTKLFGLASYDAYKRFQDVDSDFTPETLFETVQGDEAWQTYNELRLDGELAAEPVTWSLGGYYLREELDNDGTTFVTLNPDNANFNTRRVYSQKIDSYAFWGDFGWEFADDFTLEGGVRWNWERKQFEFRKIGGNFQGSTVSAREEATFQTPTGQLILTYHIDADKAAYARYTRGFKAGHFNALASRNLDAPPAKEEYNDAWETGLRGAWFGGLMSLGAAGFYYKYENYQVFLFSDSSDVASPPFLEIVNAKQAENYGIELDGQIAPLRGWAPRIVEGLRVSGNFGWLHGEYLDFTTTRFFKPQVGPVNPIPVSYAGLPLQNAPEFKASGTVEWTFDLGRWGYLIPRYDVNWSDDVFFDPNEGHGSIDESGKGALPDYAIGQKAFYLHNVRLAYRIPTGNVELAGWVRNVEDTVYKNFAFDASKFTGVTINFPGQPRTIGFDVVVTF